MRALLLILLGFSSVAGAQITIGDMLKNTKEAILGTECEQLLDEARKATQYSLHAANAREWEAAFRYDDTAFNSLVMANSVCVDEPENLKTAIKYLDENKLINQELVCVYHAQEGNSRVTRARLAIKHFNDVELAVYHLRWGIYYIDEATSRCTHTPERVEKLKLIKMEATNLLEKLESEINPNG